MKKRFIYLFILIAFILSCTKINRNDDKDKKDFPDVIQVSYKHYIYKNGYKYIEALIDYARFFEKTNKIECKKILANIYNSKGVLVTKIVADKADIDKSENIFFFKTNVVVEHYEKKTTMVTDELKLDYKNNKLICEKEVTISKKDGSFIKANNLESNLREQKTNFSTLTLKYFYEDKDNTSDQTKDKK